jgi:nitrogen fixation NifU-like protein
MTDITLTAGQTLTSETADLYAQVLLDAAHHPQYRGHLANPDLKTIARNASCGDVIAVELQLSPDKQTITAVKWQGEGCIISQAHMDVLAAELAGQPIAKVKTWDKPEILALFGLATITPGREKCLMLSLRAVQQALT